MLMLFCDNSKSASTRLISADLAQMADHGATFTLSIQPSVVVMVVGWGGVGWGGVGWGGVGWGH